MEYKPLTWQALCDIAVDCADMRTNYDTGMTYTEFDAEEFVVRNLPT